MFDLKLETSGMMGKTTTTTYKVAPKAHSKIKERWVTAMCYWESRVGLLKKLIGKQMHFVSPERLPYNKSIRKLDKGHIQEYRELRTPSCCSWAFEPFADRGHN